VNAKNNTAVPHILKKVRIVMIQGSKGQKAVVLAQKGF
jgi:hypothetical protein